MYFREIDSVRLPYKYFRQENLTPLCISQNLVSPSSMYFREIFMVLLSFQVFLTKKLTPLYVLPKILSRLLIECIITYAVARNNIIIKGILVVVLASVLAVALFFSFSMTCLSPVQESFMNKCSS